MQMQHCSQDRVPLSTNNAPIPHDQKAKWFDIIRHFSLNSTLFSETRTFKVENSVIAYGRLTIPRRRKGTTIQGSQWLPLWGDVARQVPLKITRSIQSRQACNIIQSNVTGTSVMPLWIIQRFSCATLTADA